MVNRERDGACSLPRTICASVGQSRKAPRVTYFARGLAIGFAIAGPVGAIGLLCIRRTLADGRLVGFVW